MSLLRGACVLLQAGCSPWGPHGSLGVTLLQECDSFPSLLPPPGDCQFLEGKDGDLLSFYFRHLAPGEK